MRVLYVESAYGFGGSLTGLLHLFSALPEDVEPILLTSFDPSGYITMPKSLSHRVVEIAPRPEHPGNRFLGLWQYYRYVVKPWDRAVRQAIKDYQPDLVHANNSVTLNFGAGLAARKCGVPAISHQKHFEYPERLSRLLFKRSCFTQHIATSDFVGEHMREFGLASEKCLRIYEPVVGPSHEELALRQPNDVPVVAMHSMLVHWKGQHIFLSAVAELKRRNSLPFRAVIAGGPPANDDGYLNDLKKQARDLGLENLVEFRGHVRNVYEFLSTVDIAVHAAIEPEPFGRVAAEAMLAGLPNIVTRGGGPAEYVKDGAMGIHVARGDVGAMADALEILIASPEKCRQMGQAARQFALKEFSPTELAAQTVAVYRKLT